MNCALFGVVLALAVATAGCGDICSRLDGATESRNNKKKACSDLSDENFDPDRCRDGLSSCSNSDIQQLAIYAKCLEDLPVCSPDNEASFTGAEGGCVASRWGQISGACVNAVF